MTDRRRLQEFREWMKQPPVLMRWKVAVTAVAAMLVGGGLYYQTSYLNDQRAHDTECARAEGREAVRLVLFRITSLSDIFPSSPEIVVYENSTHDIIEAALPPIEVSGCPTTTLQTIRRLQDQFSLTPITPP